MNKYVTETPHDPRIRRTRNLLQRSLSTLLESKPFTNISITDICKQADIARVTFYQHYDSKEALLLAGVADFFASMYQAIDRDALDLYLETGEMGNLVSSPQIDLADPNRIRLVGVALQHIGSAVRNLAITSFLETYSKRETKLDAQETQLLATFYVGGVLTLLEQFLNGQLALSPAEFQTTTLSLLYVLRLGAIQSSILPNRQRQ